MRIKHSCILLFILLPIFYSCASTKNASYFNGLANQEIQYDVQSLEPVIQKNDLLTISVSSLNAEAAQPFNLYTAAVGMGTVNSGTVIQAPGFLVGQDGTIQFPMLGTIKAAGLTKTQLKQVITKGLVDKNILFDPIVNIRYLNYKVTVLGEVAHPSVINVPGEKITLLEALGLAGDLTPYGLRDNVLIIRDEQEGKRISQRVNLNNDSLLTSPFYYLKSNDVVYVSPNKAKAASATTTKQWLPAVISAMSFVAIIATRVFK